MPESPDELEISSVEDLDPEPHTGAGLSRTREFVLGMLLLLGVLGWSGWQWWQGQVIQTHYRLGQEAVERFDWDEARARFTAAQGYRDAEARAADAANRIFEREKQYKFALDAAGKHEWPAALQAVRAVEDIQPGYKRAESIGYDAERQVYGAALSGTIVLRTNLSQPGLYYHDGINWHLLQGSDRWSSVRGWGPRGHVLYDVPAPGWTPAPSPTPTPDLRVYPDVRTGSPELKGRRLVAAALGNRSYSFTPLAFDPSEYNFFQWGSSGVWAFGAKSLQPGSGTDFYGGDIWHTYHITYQAYTSTITSTLTRPAAEWALVEIDPRSDKLLIIERGEAESGMERDLLYMADADGSGRTLLYAQTGQVSAPRFDPAGRYLLFRAHSPTSGSQAWKHSLILLDTTGEDPPRVLGETFVFPSDYGNPFPPLTAEFLTQGENAGKILVGRWNSYLLTLSVYDPSRPDVPPEDVTVGSAPTGMLMVQEVEDGGLVVLWQNDQYGRRLASRTGIQVYENNEVIVAWLPPGRAWVTASLPLLQSRDYYRSLSYGQVRGDYLVYAGEARPVRGENEPVSYLVRSVPLREVGTASAEGASRKIATLAYDSISGPLQPFRFGPGVLAYISEGRLHALTYDGSIDLRLEGGIGGIYDFSAERIFLGR